MFSYADVTTRIQDKVKLKSPDGKTREYYKVSQDNAFFTVLSSPDRVDFPVSAAATMVVENESNNGLLKTIIIIESAAILGLASALIAVSKKKKNK